MVSTALRISLSKLLAWSSQCSRGVVRMKCVCLLIDYIAELKKITAHK